MPMTVHFLNVGEGDCTIIEHASGRISVIDLSSIKALDETSLVEARAADSVYQAAKNLNMDLSIFEASATKVLAERTDALDYFDRHIGRHRDIFRLIITHPHMDHVTGLDRLVNGEQRTVENFWHSSKLNFGLDDSDWSKVAGRYRKEDWLAYKSLRDSGAIRAFDQRRGAERSFWTEDGIEIWSPTDNLVTSAKEKSDPNILSMVLAVTHAGTTVVLGGDATGAESWDAIWPVQPMGHVSVLKASHHGRNSGYHQPSVKEMSPWLTIASVGAKEHDATSKYRQYSEYTVSMRFTGDIKITINDDGQLTYPSVIAEHWKPKT